MKYELADLLNTLPYKHNQHQNKAKNRYYQWSLIRPGIDANKFGANILETLNFRINLPVSGSTGSMI